MPKSVEDIIVPERRRSIRDIPIPASRKRPVGLDKSTESPLKEAQNVFINKPQSPVSPPPTPPMYPRSRGRSKFRLWGGILLALIIVVFGLLSFFDSSTLSYNPKSANLSLNNEVFSANKEGGGNLIFSVVKLSRDLGKEVSASGQEEVSRKASGTIVVYNNASTEPQRLIATTRFESSDGKVYRVANDFVIPGMTIVSGANRPGSVEITVVADQPGSESNIGLSDFTLPGLRGTPRFQTIYARSKTPMTGGFVGVEKGVSEADRERTVGELEVGLKSDLTSEALAQVPAGFVLIPSLSSFVFEDMPQSAASDTNKVVLNRRGHLYGIMFKRGELSTHLAKETISIRDSESVDLIGLENLNFAYVDTSPQDLSSLSEFDFSVSADSKVVWRTDEVALKADLAGKNKRELPQILNNYPTIVSAKAVIRPFWKRSFPTDVSNIVVKQEVLE